MKKWLTFIKSLIAGGAATLADIGVFAGLHHGLGVDARWANIVAMVVGGVVNFVGNRQFAFRAGQGDAARQARRFFIVSVIAWALNAALFDLTVDRVSQWVPSDVLRLVTGNAIYLGFSYPMFKRVFRVPVPGEKLADPP